MYSNRIQGQNRSERGNALAMIILSVAGLAALSGAMMSISLGSAREQGAEVRESQATYMCQAGLSQSMYQMQRGLGGAVGTQTNPTSWGGGRFWVSATATSPDITNLRATGLENGVGMCQELVVRAVPVNMWTWGLYGRESANLDSSVRLDSYDSTQGGGGAGAYAAQVVGSGLTAHAGEAGGLGSNGDIFIGPATNVWGDATPGPSHTVQLSGGTVSGSTTPATAPMDFPAINVPTYTNFGPLNVNSDTTLPAENRTYSNVRVRSNKVLTITGPAEVVMSNLTLDSNAQLIIDDTLGPVTLTVIDNFILNQYATMHATSYNPASLRINMLSDNVADPEIIVRLDNIVIGSNSSIYGCVYAPEARITIDSEFSLYGSLMARSLDLDSNCNFHFDEHLLESMWDGTVTYETVSWREVPYHD
jgi:hypothetical protein